MIDMVVHRHKMRETLSRICQLLMVRTAPKSAERGKSKRLNGQPYVNGRAVDANLIESGSRPPAEPAIEPEILGPEERFDASRLESREVAAKTTRPQKSARYRRTGSIPDAGQRVPAVWPAPSSNATSTVRRNPPRVRPNKAGPVSARTLESGREGRECRRAPSSSPS